MQSLARCLEQGGVLSLAEVTAAAQPFLAAILRREFPNRPIVVVAEGLKAQESFHQDLTTWLQGAGSENAPDAQPSAREPAFYPSWEILPHEGRLPHLDVISERLQTLVALTRWSVESAKESPPGEPRASFLLQGAPAAPVVVTSVVALLQRTFPQKALQARTRTLRRGLRLEPLDLVEWLEE